MGVLASASDWNVRQLEWSPVLGDLGARHEGRPQLEHWAATEWAGKEVVVKTSEQTVSLCAGLVQASDGWKLLDLARIEQEEPNMTRVWIAKAPR